MGYTLQADLLLLELNKIKIDKSNLTEESVPVSKELFELYVKNTTKKALSPIILAISNKINKYII